MDVPCGLLGYVGFGNDLLLGSRKGNFKIVMPGHTDVGLHKSGQ